MEFEFGRNQAIIAGVLVVVGLLIAGLVLMGSGANTAGQAELVENCEAIRQAEIEYKQAFENYLSAKASPRDPVSVDEMPVAWEPSRGFKKLSWSPATDKVLGSYTVTAKANGFVVVGVADADGDGKQARCEATHEAEAKLTSAEDIY